MSFKNVSRGCSLEIEDFLCSFESMAPEEYSIMTRVQREAEANFLLDEKHSV